MLTIYNNNKKNIAIAFSMLVAFFLCIRQIYGEDIGFHLASAQQMLTTFSFPDKDTLTYTATDHSYIDLNWLYQLFIYELYTVFGDKGLVLFNAFMVALSIGLLFKRTDDSNGRYAWFVLVGILAMSPAFEIRPHSFSWVFLSLTLLVFKKFYEGNGKIIRWLPVILLFWVNTHSLFILGLAAIGAYGPSVYLKKKELLKPYLQFTALSVLICLLNPYGWKGFALPFEQFFALQQGNIFKQHIRELQSPFSITNYNLDSVFTAWHFYDLFLVLSLIIVLVNRKQIKIHEWLILILFFYFSFSAVKNIGYTVIAIVPILAMQAKKEKKKKNTELPPTNKYSSYLTHLYAPVCLLLITGISTNAFYIHYRQSYRFGTSWSNATLPVKATAFINKNTIRGKILNQLDFGGYLEFFAHQQTSIDGRLDVMGESIFLEQIDAVNDDQKTKLIDKLQPEIILFAYFSTPDWITYLQKRPDWRLVYVDETAALYLKNTFMANIPSIGEQEAIAHLQEYSNQEIDALVKKGIESKLFSSFFNTQYYPEGEFNYMAFCYYYRWMKAVKLSMVDAFKKSTGDYPELYQNMGSLYFYEQNAPMSLFCYEKFLKSRKNEEVEKRVQFLKTKVQQ